MLVYIPYSPPPPKKKKKKETKIKNTVIINKSGLMMAMMHTILNNAKHVPVGHLCNT